MSHGHPRVRRGVLLVLGLALLAQAPALLPAQGLRGPRFIIGPPRVIGQTQDASGSLLTFSNITINMKPFYAFNSTGMAKPSNLPSSSPIADQGPQQLPTFPTSPLYGSLYGSPPTGSAGGMSGSFGGMSGSFGGSFSGNFGGSFGGNFTYGTGLPAAGIGGIGGSGMGGGLGLNGGLQIGFQGAFQFGLTGGGGIGGGFGGGFGIKGGIGGLGNGGYGI